MDFIFMVAQYVFFSMFCVKLLQYYLGSHLSINMILVSDYQTVETISFKIKTTLKNELKKTLDGFIFMDRKNKFRRDKFLQICKKTAKFQNITARKS